MISLIAAQSENRVIGNGSEIPWRVKGEQALFKEITLGGTLIMGRKTYDSIGRPLPGRTTIVVTRNTSLKIDGCVVVSSLDEAVAEAQRHDGPDFVAGGGEMYLQAMSRADAIHLTTIHTTATGDIFFPEVPAEFVLTREQEYESNINYTYRYYERR